MTLRELEALGAWNYYVDGSDQPELAKVSAYAALASVGRGGGYAAPANGMAVKISDVDLVALLREMSNVGPTPNDGNAS